ncbi:MAG: hypothetical protein ACLP8A_05445 [Methylovirgula sp.]
MLAAAVLALGLSVIAASDDGAASYPVNAYLCESAEYAMAFASAIAADNDEEIAKDVVGKIAKREVCGRYIGEAFIQQQKTVVEKGIIYRLIALQFREDKRVAWLAERVFDVQDHSSLQRL